MNTFAIFYCNNIYLKKFKLFEKLIKHFNHISFKFQVRIKIILFYFEIFMYLIKKDL